MNPEHVPDKTLSELDEMDDIDGVDLEKDIEENLQETRAQREILAAAAHMARLFEAEHITLRDYIRFVEATEDFCREQDIRMP